MEPGTPLQNTLVSNSGRNTLNGGSGADSMRGLRGNDTYVVDNAGDRVSEAGGSGKDVLSGGGGRDTLFGDNQDDTLNGGGGNDRLEGGSHNDLLIGGGGNDTLNGNGGRDVLRGGTGKDAMNGGGPDVFDFNNRNESGRGNQADDIRGFQHGQDDIDLRGVIGPKFKFIGEDAFDGSGRQVRLDDNGRNVTVEIDINGNSRPNMEIDVLGVGTLKAGDFLL